MKKSIFAVVLLFLVTQISGQTPTNLHVFEGLTGVASTFISANYFPGDRIPSASLELPGDYKVLSASFRKNLTDNGIMLVSGNAAAVITLKNAAVTYSPPFTKNFLGDYFTERTAFISGDMGSSETKFRFETVDTIKLSEVKELENRGLPFTMSDIPKEPFWGSFTNIAIAAGATVLAVILFFTVRTN